MHACKVDSSNFLWVYILIWSGQTVGMEEVVNSELQGPSNFVNELGSEIFGSMSMKAKEKTMAECYEELSKEGCLKLSD